MKAINLCKYLVLTALTLALGWSLPSCINSQTDDDMPELKLSPDVLNFTLAPNGEAQPFNVLLTGNGYWEIDETEGIDIHPMSGTTSAVVQVTPSDVNAKRQTEVKVHLYGYIAGQSVSLYARTLTVNQTSDGSAILPNDGLTPETAFSVKQVIEKANEIGDTESSDNYYIKGIVASINENFDGGYGNATYYIKDQDSPATFYVYRSLYLGNKSWSAGNATLNVDDEVIICGKITNYNGNTPETVQNKSYLYALNGKTADGGSTGGDNPGGGDESNLSGFESQAAFVASSTDSNNWTYSISDYTVNGAKATGVKLGKSGYNGVFTSKAVGVSGDKVLSLYGVAWNGMSATLYVRVNGGGQVDGASSVALKANPTAAGSGALTMTVSDSDYYTFKLTNLTPSSTITLSSSESFIAGNTEGRAILARIRLTDTDEGPESGSGSGSGGGNTDPEPGPGTGTEGSGLTADSPFNVAQIIAKAKETGQTNSADYYFKGTVSSIKEAFSAQYGNATFYIKDNSTSETFYVFRTLYLGNRKWTDGDATLKVGDEVVIYGKVTNYMGNTPETAQNESCIYMLNGQTAGDDGGNTGGGNGGGDTDPDPGPGTEPEQPVDPTPEAGTFTLIDNIANLTAGSYYMAGYSESYTNNGTTTTYAPYSYHIWTGGISSNGDINTVNYQYAEGQLTLNPNLSEKDAVKGTAVAMTLEAVSGKTNTYYIKYNGQYLGTGSYTENRKLQLTDNMVEWSFSAHEKGGIMLTASNGSASIILGTGGATYDLLRSYKSPASSLTYGVCFFKAN